LKRDYNILLIQPNIDLANEIIFWLDGLGNVVHVTDKNQAQEQAVVAGWNLVITDINSTEIDDLQITKLVKKANPSTAILIITENVKVDFLLTAMQHHADGLFFKPLDKHEFTTRVLQLAEESHIRQEKEKKIVLAIGAHPDDVEIGCGGTLAKLRAEGSRLNILTLSLGAAGGEPEVRKNEAEMAARLLGAKLFLGSLDDTKINNTIETIQFIEGVVHQVKPTHIYTHSFYDSHQDHRSIYQASITACRHIPNLFSYQSPSCTVDFRPNTFINIDHYMEEKINAIALYASQLHTRPYLHSEMIMATARYWGRFCNYNLVEPMEVIKEHS
jgi:LmbE family N-acetylglucosaminyl deacetylase